MEEHGEKNESGCYCITCFYLFKLKKKCAALETGLTYSCFYLDKRLVFPDCVSPSKMSLKRKSCRLTTFVDVSVSFLTFWLSDVSPRGLDSSLLLSAQFCVSSFVGLNILNNLIFIFFNFSYSVCFLSIFRGTILYTLFLCHKLTYYRFQ